MKPTYTNNALTRRKLPISSPFDQTETLVIPDLQAQAAPPALPGPHYVGPFDTGTVNNVYWPNIRKCQYPWVTIVGAGQFNEARDFARNVQLDPIRTNVVFRHWKSVLGSANDNGRLNDLTGAQWIERVGSQHIGAPYWIMPDNEGLGALVVKHSAELIPLASERKLKLAVGAWSSHNPARADWPLYMPLFEQLYKHPEHVYAPHIYYSDAPKSVRNVDGFKLVADHLAHVEKVMTAPIPFKVVITELGRLSNKDGKWLDPDKGYALEGLSEAEYADELARLAANYPKWFFVVFSRGAWGTRGSLGVGKVYEERMEQYASGEVPMPPVPPVEEAPPSVGAWKRGKLKRVSNVRKDVGVAASNPVLETLPVGHEVEYLDKDPLDFSSYYWVKIHTTTPKGQRLENHHIALTGTEPSIANQIEPISEPAPPPAPPPDEPEPTFATVAYVDQKIEDSTEYNAAKFEALTKRILELETIVSKLVAAYGKGHLEAVELVKELPKSA